MVFIAASFLVSMSQSDLKEYGETENILCMYRCVHVHNSSIDLDQQHINTIVQVAIVRNVT